MAEDSIPPEITSLYAQPQDQWSGNDWKTLAIYLAAELRRSNDSLYGAINECQRLKQSNEVITDFARFVASKVPKKRLGRPPRERTPEPVGLRSLGGERLRRKKWDDGAKRTLIMLMHQYSHLSNRKAAESLLKKMYLGSYNKRTFFNRGGRSAMAKNLGNQYSTFLKELENESYLFRRLDKSEEESLMEIMKLVFDSNG